MTVEIIKRCIFGTSKKCQIGIYLTKAFPWGKVDFPFCPEEGQNGKDG